MKKKVGISFSVGIGPNKLIAKIASEINKPDGLTVVGAGNERKFLAPLPISKLWGVGKATQKELAVYGVKTIGDLAEISHDLLKRKFGLHGSHLYNASHAIDDREVVPDNEIKSIGHEETFSTDIIEMPVIKKEFLALCVKVARRLRGHGLKAKTIMAKVKYYDFVQVTRSLTLKEPTDDSHVLYQSGKNLLGQTLVGKKPVRLVGITAANLSDGQRPVQASLFVSKNQDNECRKKLNEAMDSITDKYGSESLKPATLVADINEKSK